METKELKIQIPEGYEIDKKKSTFEKIVFKKKENIGPRSWEEYCYQQQAANKIGYFINDGGCDIDDISWIGCQTPYQWRNVLPSRELTKSFLAMMQLMSLRQAWIGDWEAKWGKHEYGKWCIVIDEDRITLDLIISKHRSLSFPTKQMCEDFMNHFKDLLEIAKPLI